ncbi:inorganic phosphate transporter [Candidatus Bathyarchaeota archaeon]|nr:inorganic phosphate transporter [Candidatus Bathyarchaeota archaeon]
MYIPLTLLATLLAFIFGANNIGLTNYGFTSAGPRRRILFASCSGLLLGAALEGYKMERSIVNGIVPGFSLSVSGSLLLANLIIMAAATHLKMPVSMTMMLVLSAIPVGLASGLHVDWNPVALNVLSWIVSPILILLSTLIIYRLLGSFLRRLSLLRVTQIRLPMISATTLVISYALGANNIGLLHSLIILNNSTHDLSAAILLGLAAVSGGILYSRGTSETLGYRIVSISPNAAMAMQLSIAAVIWILTQVSIPISLTQLLVSGAIFIHSTRRWAVIDTRLVKRLILSWIFGSAASAVIAPASIILFAWAGWV